MKKSLIRSALLLIALIVHFGISTMSTMPTKHHDVIIVLGVSANRNNEPNVFLRQRLDKAIELLNYQHANRMILTGAAVSDEIPEAKIMQDYCLRKGVSADAILLESKARNTKDNAELSAELMRAYNLKSAIIVTSKHHIPRSRLHFSDHLVDFEMMPAQNNFLTYIASIPLSIREKFKVWKLQRASNEGV